MRHRIYNGIFGALFLFGACTNYGTAGVSVTGSVAGPGTGAGTGTGSGSGSSTAMTFQVSLPTFTNRKFSAYVFANTKLVGVVRSSAMTNAAGALTVQAMAVDANNCATTTGAVATTGTTYNIHIRIDGNSNSNFIYPTGCASDAGFLSTASQGYATMLVPYSYNGTYYSYWPYSVSYVYSTYTSSFYFYNTGLGTVSRQVYCNIVDGQILNPTIYTTSALGFAQGSVSFSSGIGNATTTMTFASAAATNYKYACWIDFNNSGTYNSGDLIASGPGSSASIYTWTTVP